MQEVKENFTADYTIDSKRTTHSVKDENHLFYYEEEKRRYKSQ